MEQTNLKGENKMIKTKKEYLKTTDIEEMKEVYSELFEMGLKEDQGFCLDYETYNGRKYYIISLADDTKTHVDYCHDDEGSNCPYLSKIFLTHHCSLFDENIDNETNAMGGLSELRCSNCKEVF